MRLNRMSQKMARTQLRAIAALDTGRSRSIEHRSKRNHAAPYDWAINRQNNQTGHGFGDMRLHRLLTSHHPAHHWAAVDDHIIIIQRTTGASQAICNRRTQWSAYDHRFRYRTGDSQVFMRERAVLYCIIDAQNSCDIADYAACHTRQAARRA